MVHQSQYCPYPCIFLNRASIVISDYHVGCCTGLLSFLQVLYSTKLSTDQPFIQVVSLMATAVEHLVTGETMQFSTSREQRRRLAISHHHSSSIICNGSNQEMQNKMHGQLLLYLLHFLPFVSMPLFLGSDMILKICAVWNTICRRHTTKQHHWYQIVARLLLFLQGTVPMFHCLHMNMVETWFVNNLRSLFLKLFSSSDLIL